MDRDMLLADLGRDEGRRLAVYDDATGKPIVAGSTVVGHPTIGYGRLLTADRGITLAEARLLLDADVSAVENELDVRLPWWRDLSPARQRALANMAFNMGLPRLLGFARMLAALRMGDYQGAAAEALDSRWATQVGARADRIADLFRKG